MIVFVLTLIILALLATNIALWKFGFVHDAENPVASPDQPVTDSKEQKAILRRLRHWRENGKLSREEFERMEILCRADWNLL